MTCNDSENTSFRKKTDKLELRNELDGSKTLILNQIKIKDLDKWSTVKVKDFNSDGVFKEISTDLNDENEHVLRMNQQVEVTYHRIDLFKEMFSEYFDS